MANNEVLRIRVLRKASTCEIHLQSAVLEEYWAKKAQELVTRGDATTGTCVDQPDTTHTVRRKVNGREYSNRDVLVYNTNTSNYYERMRYSIFECGFNLAYTKVVGLKDGIVVSINLPISTSSVKELLAQCKLRLKELFEEYASELDFSVVITRKELNVGSL